MAIGGKIFWKREETVSYRRHRTPGKLEKIKRLFHRPSIKMPSDSRGKFKRRYGFIITIAKFLGRQYKYFLIIGVIGGLLLLGNLILRTDYFKVKEIRFEGAGKVDQQSLEKIADKYKGKNIYSVDLDDLEKDVGNTSVYIKEVYARKELPSKLVVEVTERSPEVVYVNFTGVYLLDKDNYVVLVPVSQTTDFTKDEWEAYYSKDVELTAVKERVKADWEEEHKTDSENSSDTEADQEKFDYSKINAKVKQAALQSIKDEISQIINTHFSTLDKQINESEYAGLQRIYFYDDSKYKEGEVVESKSLDYTIEVLDFFDHLGQYSVTRSMWQSKFSLTIYTLESKEFIFGTNRDILDQIEDLKYVLLQLQNEGKNFSKIDLRAETVSVR